MNVMLALCVLPALLASPNDDTTCDYSEADIVGTSLIQTGDTLAAPSASAACTWQVFYDKWIPSFEPGEYQHAGSQGGAHCLTACCEDPTCKGLSLKSDEMYQCYKYSRLPEEVGLLSAGQTLGNGQWLGQFTPAWSVFAKVGGAGPAAVLPAMAPVGATCGWSVHYDLWLDTFIRGEYEPPNAYGGAHCLVACCQDPTCIGLALMSDEEYQCYKYKSLPTGLASHQATPLGDGKWLSDKKPAWSIFIKTPAVVQLVQSADADQVPLLWETMPRAGSVTSHALPRNRFGHKHTHWQAAASASSAPIAASPLIMVGEQVLGSFLQATILATIIGGMALLYVRLFAPEMLPDIHRRIATLAGEPETTKLLKGVDLGNLSEMSTIKH